jgi:Tfp pilus assembly protein PilF
MQHTGPVFRRLAAVAAVIVVSSGTAVWAQAELEAEARFSAGLMHLRENRPQLAVEEFKAAIKQDKDNPYFHKGLGLAYARLNKLDDAIDELRRALQLNPYYVDVRNDLGTVLLLKGKREEGKRELMTAFNDPTNPTPETSARNLGRAYFEEGRYAEALNWFQTSLARNDSYADAYLGVADVLLAMGRVEDAIAQLETALEKLPEVPDLLVSLGVAYYRAGRLGDARTRLEEAARKDPGGVAGLRAAQMLKSFPNP